MKFRSALTLCLALLAVSGPAESASKSQNIVFYNPPLGSRKYVAEKLWNIFIRPDNDKIKNGNFREGYEVLFRRALFPVLENPLAFGGPCSPYRAETYKTMGHFPAVSAAADFRAGCPKDFSEGTSAEFETYPSVLRAGSYARACEALLYYPDEIARLFPLRENQTIANLLKPASLTPENRPRPQDIGRVYDIFSPGRTLSSDIQKPLWKLVEAAARDGQSPPQQWKVLAYAFCRSSASEAL